MHVWREANQPADFLGGWASTTEEIIFLPIFLAILERISRDETYCKYSRL